MSRIEGGIEFFESPVGEYAQCARCGGDVEFVNCWQCSGEGSLGSDCIDDLCHGGECIHGDDGAIVCDICRGTGSFGHCMDSPEWCEAHPVPGREDIKSTAMTGRAWEDAL